MKAMWKELKESLSNDVTKLKGLEKCAEGSESVRLGGKVEGVKHTLERIRQLESISTKPQVVTLCGSTRFQQEFEYINERLTLDGKIVLSCGVFAHYSGIELTEAEKEHLDDLHLRKIEMSDLVVVVNVNGYIGENTKREIVYAQSIGTPVQYFYEEK